MRKNKRVTIVLSGIILCVLLGGIVFKYFHSSKDNSEYNKINSYVNSIIDKKLENIEEEESESIKKEINDILQHSTNKEIISKSKFILGHIDRVNSDWKSAIEKYNEAIDNLSLKVEPEYRSIIYYELSKAYLSEGEYEKSEEEFNKIIELAKKHEEFKDIFIKLSMRRSFDLYKSEDGIDSAIDFTEKVYSIAKDLNCELIYKVDTQLGVLYWYADRNVESINYKLKALSILEEKQLEGDIAELLADIAIDYVDIGNYQEALKYLLRAYEYDIKDEDKNAEVKSYIVLNLVDCYNRLNDFENSGKYYKIFYSDYINDYENESIRDQMITVMNLYRGDYEIRRGNLEEAQKLLNLSKKQFEEANEFYFYNYDIALNQTFGDLYYKLGEYEEALRYHKESERLVVETDVVYPNEELNDKIYLDYKALGDNENTIKYLEKNNQLKSETSLKNNIQYSQYLLNEFEAKKNTNTIVQLKHQGKTMLIFIVILIMVTCLIGIFVVIISIKNKEIIRLNKLFKSLSITDGLTQISNRRALDDLLDNNWSEYKQNRMPISFIMMDIDYFKKYNDNYGHLEGDKVLKDVADIIKESCRPNDFVSRYGGEEFIIILLETEKKEAISIIERIQKNIKELDLKHDYSEVSDRITLSIGASISNYGENRSYKEYIKEADEALYNSKEKGRNTYTFFDDIKK